MALLFNAAAMAAFAWFDRARPVGSPSVLALQLAFSAEAFRRILVQWGAAGVEAYRRATLLAGSWFPIAYSLLFSSLIARLLTRSGLGSSRRWLPALALPFVAALLDSVENALHLVLLRSVLSASEGLRRPAQPSPALVAVASTAALIKWGLLAVSLLVILLLILRVAGRLLTRASS